MDVLIIRYPSLIKYITCRHVCSMLCAGQSQDCPDPCFAHGQSQDCAANPWFAPQTMDPGFAQDNPGIAQIHALRVTYSCYSVSEYNWYCVLCIITNFQISCSASYNNFKLFIYAGKYGFNATVVTYTIYTCIHVYGILN